MLPAALVLLAVCALLAVALFARRRRSAPAPALGTPRAARPAGLAHLAASVSDLSDARLELPRALRPPQKPRLGVLLGLR